MTSTAPSTFALGTSGWGTKTTGDDVDRLYEAFRAAGQNTFDTAHIYACWLPNGLGASERALGEIVRRRGDRANVILATKGGHPRFADSYPRPDGYLAPEVIAQDIAQSLERLSVDSIDMYFLHRDDPRVPVGEIVDTVNEHVGTGAIRQIGVSNWTTPRIAEANCYAAAKGKRPFVAHQAKLSLAVSKPSKDPSVPLFGDAELAWHASSQMPIWAYTSTASGYFATDGARGGGGLEQPISAARLREANRLAHELAATPNQIALAWLLLHPDVKIIPLLGTANLDHLHDALKASAIRLERAAWESLSRAQAPGQ